MTNKSTAKLKAIGVRSRLETARKQAGLSQTQVAKMIGLSSPSSFSDIERGENPLSVERLILLCEIYEVDVVWVMTGIKNFDRRKYHELLERSGIMKREGEKIIELLSGLRRTDKDISQE